MTMAMMIKQLTHFCHLDENEDDDNPYHQSPPSIIIIIILMKRLIQAVQKRQETSSKPNVGSNSDIRGKYTEGVIMVIIITRAKNRAKKTFMSFIIIIYASL